MTGGDASGGGLGSPCRKGGFGGGGANSSRGTVKSFGGGGAAPGAFGLYAVSAAARTGLESLLAGWWSELLRIRRDAEAQARTEVWP